MPAKSKAQQKFMGMVHAAQKGDKAASAKVAKVAKRMKKKDAEDYASTKHKGLPKKVTVKEISKWLKKLEEFRYRKVRGVDARRVASFVNRGMNEEDLPISLRKKWEHRKYGRERHLANKYIESVSVNELIKLFQKTAIKKAIDIAKKMKDNMTGAVKKIEKMNRGLSDQPDVAAALKKANESINEMPNFDRGTSGLPKGFTDDYYKIVKKLSKGKGYLTLSKSDKKKVWATLGKIYTESVK